jgi:hypothetical protein
MQIVPGTGISRWQAAINAQDRHEDDKTIAG